MPADKKDDTMKMFWDDASVSPHRRFITNEMSMSDKVQPGDMVIGTSKNRILVVIHADGTLEYGPEYRPNEAAIVFWEEMGRRRLQMEDRLLTIHHMDAVLTRLGDADLRAESARRIAANNPTDMEMERQAIEAVNRVEMVAGEAIELGRALVRRPGIPMPAFPDEIPTSVQEQEHSEYRGKEGVGADIDEPLPEDDDDNEGGDVGLN
jgi:hypothetical protein